MRLGENCFREATLSAEGSPALTLAYIQQFRYDGLKPLDEEKHKQNVENFAKALRASVFSFLAARREERPHREVAADDIVNHLANTVGVIAKDARFDGSIYPTKGPGRLQYGKFLLYSSAADEQMRTLLGADNPIAVQIFPWGPHQLTPIHDHPAECASVVLKGPVQEYHYAPLEDGRMMLLASSTRNDGHVADAGYGNPPHQIANLSSSETAMTLHLYRLDGISNGNTKAVGKIYPDLRPFANVPHASFPQSAKGMAPSEPLEGFTKMLDHNQYAFVMHDHLAMDDDSCYDLVIVGAGFTGTMIAVNATRYSRITLRIALIDRTGTFGEGAAFGPSNGECLLNVPAGAMGAFPEAGEDFVRWLEENNLGSRHDAKRFLPRSLYGLYLTELLKQAERSGHRIVRMQANIVDMHRTRVGWSLIKEGSSTPIRARRVVLATGTLSPSDPLANAHDHPRYSRDSWAFLREKKLDTNIDTLIIGTGLSALDIITTFARNPGAGKLYAISRHGRFPLPHAQNIAPRDPFQNRAIPASARELLAAVRQEIRAGQAEDIDWRSFIDGLRPRAQALWKALNVRERQRFVRHIRPFWEYHRHRAPESVLAAKDALIAQGRLTVIKGSIASFSETPDALDVHIGDRATKKQHTVRVGHIINCCGPSLNYGSGEPLLERLLERGEIERDHIGLGLAAQGTGQLLDAAGQPHTNLFTVGWPLRGIWYESGAVRELRQQADDLARLLVANLQAPPAGPVLTGTLQQECWSI